MPVGERRNELTNARPLACAEGFCFREFRHSYLTALARADVHSKVMQVLAGHATCATIMDIYAHVNMDSKREAAEALAKAVVAAQPEPKQAKARRHIPKTQWAWAANSITARARSLTRRCGR